MPVEAAVVNQVSQFSQEAMQNFTLKFGDARNNWKCCFCCHVRTGTIFLGIWHLMLHVLTLSVLAVLLRHPEMMLGGEATIAPPGSAVSGGVGGGVHPAPLPTPLSVDVDFQSNDVRLSLGQGGHAPHPSSSSPWGDYHPAAAAPGHHALLAYRARRQLTYQDLNVGFVITFCTFSITLLMVYGAIRGKPSYLMPFFCLQVFDFCLASLTALGYIFFLPDAHRIVETWPTVPFQSMMLNMDRQSLCFLIILVFTLAMVVKAYFLGVVWGCYKYLSLRILAAQRTIHYIDPDVQTLLPDYDAALKKFPQPPPSYASAIALNVPPQISTSASAFPPPYPGLPAGCQTVSVAVTGAPAPAV
ncbi:lysosomal-associated transmembrane protein 4B isoform X2 [Nilaparvata lugens]|uniref:lysosomal-associated transmembrane protein 4B isoform X2 n=1 Tax=Nilaparvata lugens TaxID=108931 RepID=UPI00193E68F8|nr:lysosomal-associated transmembrane protein 4B isoform X2 [Nilaparvata lugens]